MRSISALGVMAVLAVGGTYAQADSIVDGTFTFTEPANFPYPVPTAGSFVWDSTTSTWKSFTVDWDGAVFNFAKVFPDLADLPTEARWCADGPGINNCAAPGRLALYQTKFNTAPEQSTWTDLSAFAYGGYTVKETATTAGSTPAGSTPAGARKCGRAPGRPHRNGDVNRDRHQQERDDGHDCGRGRGGPHSKAMTTASAAVPEPATLGLMVLGLLGAGFAGRKRRR